MIYTDLSIERLSVWLDFIYKIIGPIAGVIILVIAFRNRNLIADFVVKYVDKIKGKVLGQEFEIDLQKIKQSQSEAVKVDEEKENLRNALEFEKIYSIIFGSQIDFLKLLRGPTKEGISVSEFEFYLFFDNIQQKYSIFRDWTPSEFLKILINNSLMEDQNFKITKKGLDFLEYIKENNYNDRLF